MITDREEVIKLFEAKKSGHRGWYLGTCPFCGKKEHCGFIFGKKVSSFSCKKCGEQGVIIKALKHLNRLDLLARNYSVDIEKGIKSFIVEEMAESELNLELPLKPKPLGFKRLKTSTYLEGRGFNKKHFEIYKIGTSALDPRLGKDYFVFLLENDEEQCVGWLARSVLTKKEIDAINKKRKQKGIDYKYLRWINSTDTDFVKFLFGAQEINDNTKLVILVEGVTSKANVDTELDLLSNDEIKCCATFGKKVSREQIKILQELGVSNIILLYDPDAVKENKQYGLELEKYFNVNIGYIDKVNEDGSSKDPGDMDENEILEVLEKAEPPEIFFRNKINYNKLKL